jgi:hypothetical protein
VRDDRRGHVEHAVLVVEAVRRLDLPHLFAGRDFDGERALDELLFFGSGFEEVDPDRLRRQRGAGLELSAFQPFSPCDEDVEQA